MSDLDELAGELCGAMDFDEEFIPIGKKTYGKEEQLEYLITALTFLEDKYSLFKNRATWVPPPSDSYELNLVLLERKHGKFPSKIMRLLRIFPNFWLENKASFI